jgi:caspase recruitment domain-containing protein 6
MQDPMRCAPHRSSSDAMRITSELRARSRAGGRERLRRKGPDVVAPSRGRRDAARMARSPMEEPQPSTAERDPSQAPCASRRESKVRRSDPSHVDPSHAAPSHADPSHADPSQTIPSHADPSHVSLAPKGRAGAAPRTDAWGSAAVQPTRSTCESKARRSDPGHVDPSHADPSHTDPSHVDPSHADPSHVNPSHVDPSQTPCASTCESKARRSDPSHADPSHVDPSHADASHVDPSHADPSHVDEEERPRAGPWGGSVRWRGLQWAHAEMLLLDNDYLS